jgi:hypothetical protein
MAKIKFKIDIIWVRLNILKFVYYKNMIWQMIGRKKIYVLIWYMLYSYNWFVISRRRSDGILRGISRCTSTLVNWKEIWEERECVWASVLHTKSSLINAAVRTHGLGCDGLLVCFPRLVGQRWIVWWVREQRTRFAPAAPGPLAASLGGSRWLFGCKMEDGPRARGPSHHRQAQQQLRTTVDEMID